MVVRAVGLWAAARRVVLPVVLAATVVVVFSPLVAPWSMIDFATFWRAGGEVLAGRSPYPTIDPAVLGTGLNFVYPAPAALAMAPFALLPLAPAAAVFAVCSIASVVIALRLLAVRDLRCYALAFLYPWTLHGLWGGALTPLLLLGIALLWRARDGRRAVAALAAGLVVAKLFLWPLLLWLAVTRRLRTTVRAVLAGVVCTVLAWAVLGFAGLVEYPQLLRVLAEVEQRDGYSVVALGLALGLSVGAAQAASYVAGAALLASTILLRRREQVSLAAALAAALVLSPIVWPHYFVLALVPLALARPAFSPLWLLPLAAWLVPDQSGGVAWQAAVGLLAGLATLALSARSPSQPEARVEAPGPLRYAAASAASSPGS